MLEQIIRDLQNQGFTRGGRIIGEHGDAHAALEVNRDQYIGHHEIPKHQIRATHAISRFTTEGVLDDVRALAQTDAIRSLAHPGPEAPVRTAIRAKAGHARAGGSFAAIMAFEKSTRQ